MATKSDNDILINILLDRSGSMGGLENDVIGHYNSYIEEQAALPGRATVSLVLFDTEYEEVYINKDSDELPLLTKKTYFVRGGTAYYDALGRLIKSVDAITDKPPKVVFVINTDGQENSSKEYSAAKIKEMVEERQNNHDWQFAFIGAGIDAFEEAAKIGIRTNSTSSVAASAAGIAQSYNTLTQSTTNYRSGITQDFALAPDPVEPDPKKKKSPKTPSGR